MNDDGTVSSLQTASPLDRHGSSEALSAVAGEGDPGPGLDTLLAAVDLELGGEVPQPADTTAPEATPRRQYILFSSGGGRHAVPIENVHNIGRRPTATPVPNLPDWIRGVISFRGEILSLVDFGGLFGNGGTTTGPRARALVVDSLDGEMRTALLVDSVHGELYAGPEELRPGTGAVSDRLAPYARGTLRHQGEIWTVLDLDSLLLGDELQPRGR